MTLPSPDVSFVIPVYNEKESLAPLLAGILSEAEKLGLRSEILFIDDGSTDGSAQELERLVRETPNVRVVCFRKNFGKAAALDAGFREAQGELVVTMDADLQDDPAELGKFIEAIESGYDLVSGWKYHRKDPLARRLASRVYNSVTRRLAGVKLHDMNCGYKVYRREVVESLNLYGELHRYIPVLASSQGFRLGEVKVTHHPRQFGRSKYGIWRFFSGFFDVLTVLILTRWASRPQHAFGMVGLVLTLTGTIVTSALIMGRLFGSYLSNRPLFYLGLSLLSVGIQLVFFGFLAEMLAHSKSAQTFYSIREVKDHDSVNRKKPPQREGPR